MKEHIRNKRRAFGQNFLVEESEVQKIIGDITCTPEDWIVEIGPGAGKLTGNLIQKCDSITAIEADITWVEHLQKKFVEEKLFCIHGDATKYSYEDLKDPREEKKGKPILVGNLPYNRSTSILNHFLPHINDFQYFYFMFQHEVAKRLVAKPCTRDYGSLSVYVQSFAKVTMMQKISPEAFRPRPNVLSATLKLEALEAPKIIEPLFFLFVGKSFSMKRKKITNCLAKDFAKPRLLEVLAELGLSENTRAEEISVDDFGKLYRLLEKEWLEKSELTHR